MKCPICTRPIEPKTVITCRRCWGLLPGNERVALARMHRLRHDMTAKIAKLVRIMREKFPMLGPKGGLLQEGADPALAESVDGQIKSSVSVPHPPL